MRAWITNTKNILDDNLNMFQSNINGGFARCFVPARNFQFLSWGIKFNELRLRYIALF